MFKAVFIDRDGVINHDPGEKDYVKSWEEFKFIPGVKAAIKKLKENGYKIFVISNQAGVAKGLYSKQGLELITSNMLNGLGEESRPDAVHYCLHRDEDNCSCRKPKTGLIDAAIAGLKGPGQAIDMGSSYFVGDTIRDIETGRRAGLKTILVFSGKEKPQNSKDWEFKPHFSAKDLSGAVDIILSK